MIGLILRWMLAIVIAFFIGKLVSKLRLPAILGWLIAGMLLGPYAFQLIPDELINAAYYQTIIHVLECAVGFMIGTELVWKRLKAYGKALIVTTLTQSLGTFVLVSAVFFHHLLDGRGSHLSGLPVRRDSPCHRACACIIHRTGISYQGAFDQNIDPNGCAG